MKIGPISNYIQRTSHSFSKRRKILEGIEKREEEVLRQQTIEASRVKVSDFRTAERILKEVKRGVLGGEVETHRLYKGLSRGLSKLL
jgi:hypothetical protein